MLWAYTTVTFCFVLTLSLFSSRVAFAKTVDGQASKTDVVFVAYETLKPPEGVAAFIKARRKDAAAVQKEIALVVAGSRRMFVFVHLSFNSVFIIYPIPFLTFFSLSLSFFLWFV